MVGGSLGCSHQPSGGSHHSVTTARRVPRRRVPAVPAPFRLPLPPPQRPPCRARPLLQLVILYITLFLLKSPYGVYLPSGSGHRAFTVVIEARRSKCGSPWASEA